MEFQRPFTGATSKIELSLSCRRLRDRDYISRSDPYCIVLLQDSWQSTYFEIGRTEVVRDSLSPEWTTRLILDYNFETIQKLRFDVYDADPRNDDFLGSAKATLAEIVSSRATQFIRPLKDCINSSRKCGELVIIAEEPSPCKLVAHLRFSADHLASSICTKPRPFLVLSRSNEDGTSFSVVHRTKVTPAASRNPTWPEFQIRLQKLCNGDFERPIRLSVYKWKRTFRFGRYKVIGHAKTTLQELINCHEEGTSEADRVFVLRKDGSRKSFGNLRLQFISINEEITFLDYIRSGTQLHFAVAIDFTASNGSPLHRNSLHFLDPSGSTQNPYQVTLTAIGQIIAQYDTVGMFPGFGFGAKLPPNYSHVSHLFPLNFNNDYPWCGSIEELLVHYQNCLATVRLYGPTCFAPVITKIGKIASQFGTGGEHYFVLIIITDGIISDLLQTKQAIIKASEYPLSIVIVGVGNADFGAMEALDSDHRMLSTGYGETAVHDIVQFVEMNRYFLRYNCPVIRSKLELTRAVLAEIPDQITTFMRMKGLYPKLVEDEEEPIALLEDKPSAQQQMLLPRTSIPAIGY